jgi:hypothetical protein
VVVGFFVPTREGGEKEKADEGEDYRDNAVNYSLANQFSKCVEEGAKAYIKYGNTIISLN